MGWVTFKGRHIFIADATKGTATHPVSGAKTPAEHAAKARGSGDNKALAHVVAGNSHKDLADGTPHLPVAVAHRAAAEAHFEAAKAAKGVSTTAYEKAAAKAKVASKDAAMIGMIENKRAKENTPVKPEDTQVYKEAYSHYHHRAVNDYELRGDKAHKYAHEKALISVAENS